MSRLSGDQTENRFDIVCSKAEAMGVSLLIDAEESWMQDAADELGRASHAGIQYQTNCRLQYATNVSLGSIGLPQRPASKSGWWWISNRIQTGPWCLHGKGECTGRRTWVSHANLCLVKADTDANFDAALRYILDYLDTISLFAGTHNEESSLLLIDLMKEKNIDATDLRVWFGQLYGMSDHISYNLSERGYNVAKYLPFGPVKDVMPYLIRRAEENTSVAGQTSRELELIRQEKSRRKL